MAGFWDSLRSAFAGANAGRRRAPARRRATQPRKPSRVPPPQFRGRKSLRYGPEGKPARTREQLADRMDRRPATGQAVKKTSKRFPDAPMGYRAFEGNYPARGNIRDAGRQLEGTRSQLAQRRSQRAAQGYPASQPHPMSGQGARSAVRGVGRARRPAVGLPNYPPVVPAGRRQPQTSARTYSGSGSERR